MEFPNVSDDAHDRLVDLCFNCLRGMDTGELIQFVNAVLRIMEREAHRTMRSERRRLRDTLEYPVQN